MAHPRTVLISGATGQQGGAVAAALAGKPFEIRAMTRKPESEKAQALARKGVHIVKGDFNDPASLKPALAGAWGVFAVQTPGMADAEEEQGKRIATLAREAGVQHFVYASVASAHRKTGIPHFESKFRIEETVRSLKFPSHVILRPVFFMENLVSPWFLRGNKIVTAVAPTTVIQMIAVADIGKFGAWAFIDAARLAGREIDIAGDAVTMPAAAAALSKGLGRTITYVPIPIEEVRKNSADFAAMLEWFDRVGYNADITALEQESGVTTTKLAAWASTAARR
jgi:uncharacterized protein YbjT (DUF2867 family)